MTLKGTTPGTFWVVWLIFLQLRYQIISYTRDFLPIKFFLIYFKNFLLQLIAPWTNELTRVICAKQKWGMFGPLYPLNKHGDLYFLIVFFETGISRKLSKEVFKKKLLDNFISEESPWEKQNNSFRRWSLLGSCHNEKVECISENLPVRIRFPADYTKLNRTHFSQEMKKGLLISLALNSNQVRRSCVNWKIWKMKKNANLTWPTQH